MAQTLEPSDIKKLTSLFGPWVISLLTPGVSMTQILEPKDLHIITAKKKTIFKENIQLS